MPLESVPNGCAAEGAAKVWAASAANGSYGINAPCSTATAANHARISRPTAATGLRRTRPRVRARTGQRGASRTAVPLMPAPAVRSPAPRHPPTGTPRRRTGPATARSPCTTLKSPRTMACKPYWPTPLHENTYSISDVVPTNDPVSSPATNVTMGTRSAAQRHPRDLVRPQALGAIAKRQMVAAHDIQYDGADLLDDGRCGQRWRRTAPAGTNCAAAEYTTSQSRRSTPSIR